MNTILQLPASDKEINALIAEKIAGWHWAEAGKSTILYLRPPDGNTTDWTPCDDPQKHRMYSSGIPDYLHDANAVIELLSKHSDVEINRVGENGWQVAIMDVERLPGQTTTRVLAEAWQDTLCQAACYALLRAHGVTILEAK